MHPDDITIPGFDGKPTSRPGEMAKYRTRYLKADLSDPSQLTELENTETECLLGERLVLLSKDKYSFKENFYVVLTYLERRDEVHT